MRRILISTAILLSATSMVVGQNDFDLSSQRGEIQFINPVPGQPRTYRSEQYRISPIPQLINQDYNTFQVAAGTWNLKCPKELRYAVPELPVNHSITLRLPLVGDIASSSKLNLTVKYGDKAADKADVRDCAGAYRLTVSRNQVTVTGRDFAGAFYGLQTLRQMLEGEAAKIGVLSFCDIQDWPTIAKRGIVEGFYGTPWSHEVRLDLIDFCGRNKLNTYVFGPKDDPYHSSPHWRKPYPPEQAARIRELVEACRRNCVNFVWAIHPGKDIRWDDSDRDSLVAKLNMMYDLGVREFAIFFDDIEGAGTNPARQVELLNYLNNKFVRAHKDVGQLAVCPTDYSRMWANPRPGGALDTYGRTLDRDIDVFYTGDVVCSDLTRESIEWMNGLIQRPAYYWWNFPVSDYCRNFLLQGPVYGLDTTMTSADVSGVLSNPMEHGAASKIALYSLADYTWNPAAYIPMDSWQRALEAVAGPEAAAAYMDFAIHSADTRTGYRRDESWRTPLPQVPAQAEASELQALRRDMNALHDARATMHRTCTDTALLSELDPWLEQAEVLATRVLGAVDLSLVADTLDNIALWNKIRTVTPSESEDSAFNAHTLGTLRLVPYADRLVNDAASRLLCRLDTASRPSRRVAGNYLNLRGPAAAPLTDGDTATFYHSGQGQRPGDRITVDLGYEQPVTYISLLQGRNEEDTDYYDTFVFQGSIDGEQWFNLTDTIRGVYTYQWEPQGQAPVARYVRLARGDSRRTHWVAIRELVINPVDLEALGVRFSNATPSGAAVLVDGDLLTGLTLTDGLILNGPARWTLVTEPGAAGAYRYCNPDGTTLPDSTPVPLTGLDEITLTTGQQILIQPGTRIYELLRH